MLKTRNSSLWHSLKALQKVSPGQDAELEVSRLLDQLLCESKKSKEISYQLESTCSGHR